MDEHWIAAYDERVGHASWFGVTARNGEMAGLLAGSVEDPKCPFFEEIGPFSLALHGVFPWGLPSPGVPISRSGCDFCQRLHRASLPTL